ncbi:MAG TPA: dihydroxyacetone kinase subunit DhaK [Verrucomicrobiales bacterium]|nr:dihydroxyacetone kinase subunit DhaK [Verrucomicrobiales bacterium]
MSAAKKILNDPRNAAAEMLDGLVAAYDGEARKVGSGSIVMNGLLEGKPALLVGGGSGHEPIYHGLAGRNLADGAACGDIFAAPPPGVILDATRAVHRGKGVLYLYGNYAGDVMNFDMAAELAAEEGIEVRTVLIWDDISSAPPERKKDRRGVAGLLMIVKIAGAAAASVDTLDELERIATKARDQTRSLGVAMKAGSIPATGKPTFELPDDELEIGMGVHGEPGVERAKMMTADELVPKMLDRMFADDLPLGDGDEVVFFVNSFGATTMTELLVVNGTARKILAERGIRVHDSVLGPIVTCQEMAGFSLSFTKLDDELKRYWDMPCSSLGYSKM